MAGAGALALAACGSGSNANTGSSGGDGGGGATTDASGGGAGMDASAGGAGAGGAGTGGSGAAGAAGAGGSITGNGTPCGWGISPPTHYDHVIWITFENDAYSSVMNDSRLAYTHTLASQCGLATNFYSERDPSLPNYIAMVSGGTQGITNDNNPTNPGSLTADNIYNEVKLSGRQWRHYAESMPQNCYHKDYPPSPNAYYTVHHEAAAYFADINADCKNWMVPQGTTSSGALIHDIKNNTLPTFAILGPNDDGGCSSCGGDVDPQKLDGYLKTWLTPIFASNSYMAGRTAIFITWDEDSTFGGASEPAFSNHVATIVIAPSVPAGTKSSTYFTHYSMLRSSEEMLGLTKLLGGAATAHDMRQAFHL